MPILDSFLRQPQRLMVRRILLQIHLWAGVLLAAYLTVIGVTGALLVFEEELTGLATPEALHGVRARQPLDRVVAVGRGLEPDKKLNFISYPTEELGCYRLWYADRQGRESARLVEAAGLKPVEVPRLGWVEAVHDLHTELFLGQKGLLINGLAASGLMLLVVTGLVLWWPGLGRWRRALVVKPGVGWRRMHFDLHSAVGFWTLPFLFWWAFTGIYFCWPGPVTGLVDRVLRIDAMRMPAAAVAKDGGVARPLALEGLVEAAQKGTPQGTVSGVSLPEEARGEVTVYVDRERPGDFSKRDIYGFSGQTGLLVSLWHYGEKRTAGDWLMALIYPLHFGSLWGLGVQCVWAAAGLMLPLLAWTGLVMYWNRSLRRKVAGWRHGAI